MAWSWQGIQSWGTSAHSSTGYTWAIGMFSTNPWSTYCTCLKTSTNVSHDTLEKNSIHVLESDPWVLRLLIWIHHHTTQQCESNREVTRNQCYVQVFWIIFLMLYHHVCRRGCISEGKGFQTNSDVMLLTSTFPPSTERICPLYHSMSDPKTAQPRTDFQV